MNDETQALEITLEEAFNKSLTGLPIRTTKDSGICTLFGLLDKPPYVRVESGKEMRLSAARDTFYEACDIIMDGNYRDDMHITFYSKTDEFFFKEGVRYARQLKKKWEAERQLEA